MCSRTILRPALPKMSPMKRMFTVVLFPDPCSLLSHQRKQNHVANRLGAGQQHHQPVDADALAGGGRQSVGQRAHIILVHLMGLVVSMGALLKLLSKTLVLLHRIVQFAEGVAQLKAAAVKLEALIPIRIIWILFGSR